MCVCVLGVCVCVCVRCVCVCVCVCVRCVVVCSLEMFLPFLLNLFPRGPVQTDGAAVVHRLIVWCQDGLFIPQAGGQPAQLTSEDSTTRPASDATL